MSGHTPGPWQWDTTLGSQSDIDHIAYVHISVTGGTDYGDRFEVTGIANAATARLMAAAPEMLESLREIVEYLAHNNLEEFSFYPEARALLARIDSV